MFKYIYQDDELAWHLGPYFDHLESIEERIPAALRDPICNESRYGLESRETFHDAWLVSLAVFGPQICEPEDVFAIELTLLGPCHDRYFDLRYKGATAYRIGLKAGLDEVEWIDYRGATRCKDDLMVHEFDVLEDGMIEHRLLFVSGMTIYVKCARFEFEERRVEDTGQESLQ